MALTRKAKVFPRWFCKPRTVNVVAVLPVFGVTT